MQQGSSQRPYKDADPMHEGSGLQAKSTPTFLFFLVLGIELETLLLPGRHGTTELKPLAPKFLILSHSVNVGIWGTGPLSDHSVYPDNVSCVRKPRPVSQLVAQQVTQQFVPPTQSKKEKKDKVEKEKSEKETTSKKNSHKKTRPRLKNVDRSSAQHLEVTVGDLTVIITDFKEKTKSPPASSAASADQHSQSSSSSDNTERGVSRSSSPRGEASSLNGESH
ncbi:YY1-associated factor 2 isoform X1 [Fukomys damarensis]|nr:YY1-associated factor 2 isoform X1 [Fukomys damarensis]